MKKYIFKRKHIFFSLGTEPTCTSRRFKFQTDLEYFVVQVLFAFSKKGTFLVQRGRKFKDF